MIALLVLAFVASGAAGLIYESIWTRYLGLFVGHSAYAQIIVLVIFLGGMSLGAHVAGRRSSRLKAPLLWYAGMEFVVGLMALGFHETFNSVTAFAYASLFPSLGGVALTIVKWAVAGALIFPQSVLLGTTFPLMSAGVIRVARAEAAPGRILSTLYFANSIGAAGGVLLAGFALIQLTGLPGTLMFAAFVNIMVAVVVGLTARLHQRSTPESSRLSALGSEAESRAPRAESPLWRPLLIVAFGTAVASFVYEIAWIRMLSLVEGSATHSFELMLSAFILGLALGAVWIRRRADTIAQPVRFLGAVQWAMGLLAVATLPLYVKSFDWVASVLATVQTSPGGYEAFAVARYGIALAIMLPATFCAGMTLPLITRELMREGAGERAIGAVYAWNTLGSIAGVILAGLVLMPLLGLKKLLIAGALVDIGLGIWLVWRSTPRDATLRLGPVRYTLSRNSAFGIAVAVTAGVIAVVSGIAPFSLARLSSGVYRHGFVSNDTEYNVSFYRDGRTASVSLRQGMDGFVTLSTNGKPDASMDAVWLHPRKDVEPELLQLTRDLATQLLLPIITLAHAPRAEYMAVIGHGSGMSSHTLLGSPIAKEVVTIEIEPEMINGSRGFMPVNRRVFEDPRSVHVLDDAKSYFASSSRKFDLILSEPSNPWVSGVSGLFTLEFYQRVKGKLSPNGVFGQWLHLYELSDGLATSVLASIDAVFPAYEIFFTSNADVLVVTSNRPLPAPAWDVVTYPGIASDLKRVVPMAAEQLEALRLGGREVLRPMILARGAANSDFFPVLDLGAERTRFMKENADGYTGLSEGRFDVVAALSGRRTGFSRSTVALTPDIPRSTSLAVGATLRAMQALSPEISAQIHRTEEIRAAAYRLDQLKRMIASSQPPVDWHRWVEHVVATDEDVHSGTAGVVDTAFFTALRRFVARTGAPLEARASVDFLHGIGVWDWAEAAAAAQVLEDSKDDIPWVPAALLRNGTVVALIKLQKYAKAREGLKVWSNRTAEDPFRERLLSAYLVFADSSLKVKLLGQPTPPATTPLPTTP